MNISPKVIALLGVLAAALFLGSVYIGYQWHARQQMTDRQLASIAAITESTAPNAQVKDRLGALERLKAEWPRFDAEGMAEEVRQAYEQSVADIKAAIEADYAAAFEQSTLAEADKIENPALVAEKITLLEKQRAQIQRDAARLGDSTITDKALMQISERLTAYTDRKAAIENAQRKAEEEAARKAEEEAQRLAKSRYETTHFLVQIPEHDNDRWSATTRSFTGGELHMLRLNSGEAGNNLHVVCGQTDVENPALNYMGTSSSGCRVFLSLDGQSATTLISPGMATLTIK